MDVSRRNILRPANSVAPNSKGWVWNVIGRSLQTAEWQVCSRVSGGDGCNRAEFRHCSAVAGGRCDSKNVELRANKIAGIVGLREAQAVDVGCDHYHDRIEDFLVCS